MTCYVVLAHPRCMACPLSPRLGTEVVPPIPNCCPMSLSLTISLLTLVLPTSGPIRTKDPYYQSSQISPFPFCHTYKFEYTALLEKVDSVRDSSYWLYHAPGTPCVCVCVCVYILVCVHYAVGGREGRYSGLDYSTRCVLADMEEITIDS
jgi:hypothetical protein